MTQISIIGTGNMGQAIAQLAAKGGHQVQSLGQGDADTAISGDIIVLAVPYGAVNSIIAERREQLAGRIVVDISNPVNFETFDSLTVAPDDSAAAEIAQALPQSRLLKAFNTNFAATLVSGSIGSLTTSVLVAGDDAEAKSTLLDVVRSAGLNALDAGGLNRARELEALGFLQITLAASDKIAWTGGFGVIA